MTIISAFGTALKKLASDGQARPNQEKKRSLHREALINSTNEIKGEAHGTQQPRPITLIGDVVSSEYRATKSFARAVV